MENQATIIQRQKYKAEIAKTYNASLPDRRFLHAPKVMNEAYHYDKPSAFSRGIEIKLGQARLIIISGTASVGPEGQTLHKGDFHAQTWQAFENARAVLKSGGADFHDVIKATVFIKDIEKHYAEFNEIRCAFFKEIGIDQYPASTCIQATLCRSDLLIEMELIAIVQNN
jgi:2-iminobutanoate/2-iminopropanoate deaminase